MTNNIANSSARLLKNVLPYATLVFLFVQFWTYQAAATDPILQNNWANADHKYISSSGYQNYKSGNSYANKWDNIDKYAQSVENDEIGAVDNVVAEAALTDDYSDIATNAKVVAAMAGVMGTSMASGACCGCCMDGKKKGAGCCNCCCKCCDATLDACCPCCDEKCCKKMCKQCEKSCECCDGCCIGCPECCGCDPECGCCRRCRACCPCCCKKKVRHEPPPPMHGFHGDHGHNFLPY